MHDLRTYPPRVKMSVDKMSTSDRFVIPVKIDGCAEDGQMNVDLLITSEGTYSCCIYYAWLHAQAS